jgi:16S rRNA (cytosine967-C5)-methyltransferase
VTASAEAVKTNVRDLACEILLQVDARKAYADVLLDRTLRLYPLSDLDRALLTELVYGTLRWRGKIDAELGRHLQRPLEKTDAALRNVLRVACYQLLFLDKIPDYAAVNEAVDLAKVRRGAKAAGFVNGVLRSLLRDKARSGAPNPAARSVDEIAAEYSHPAWLVQRWVDDFGLEAARELMRANNLRAPLSLRVNLLRSNRDELLQRFADAGIEAKAGELSPHAVIVPPAGTVENLPGFSEGLFQVQGESSQLVGFLLAPMPGERVLDACAAPGGKTAHLAELMQDHGELIAVDKSAPGIEKIGRNLARLGIRSVRTMQADASEELPGFAPESFDRILLDAPCSGLGTLRAHPEIKWRRTESDIQRLSRLQAKLLRRAAVYLKPGGVMVYAICTLSRIENERNIELFLTERREFELEEAAGYLPPQARHMVRNRFYQALPQRDGTDGFFAARLRKVS